MRRCTAEAAEGVAGRDSGVTVTAGGVQGRTGIGSSSPAAATGRESEGSSRPEAGEEAAVSTPWTSPPGAPSSTACDSGAAKAGLCQVVSRAPKPVSATGPADAAVTRWIGGSADHPADLATPGPVPVSAATSTPAPVATPDGVVASSAAARRRRPPSLNLLRSPTPYPFAEARVTSPAI
ncbi:hypothetical protein [Streptomyces purpureus]|uniref:hypothetical protein n=1 Tax=Streptomyces purpureus TaxID=1951 RepID=UPI00131A3F7B|nr:hypothetical protein [Streptomyces purpureus]